MAIITKMGLLLALVGLLAMVQQSAQMSTPSMLEETGNDLSSWAIVYSRLTSERVIFGSGDFQLRSTKLIAGRFFRTGFLLGRPVVLVYTGKYSANVASALQIALSTYNIRGVLYFGNAGDLTHRAVHVGSVVIPSKVSFTAIWDWLNLDEDEEGELVFGNFNVGGNAQNQLGSIKFNNVTLYEGTTVSTVDTPRYLETDEQWIAQANKIKTRLPDITIHVGPKASSSDIKVNNAAYASFLGKSFGFEVVDQESATVALVSKSNHRPYIVFHGVYSSAGRGSGGSTEAKETATKNAYSVLKTFLTSFPQPRGFITTYV